MKIECRKGGAADEVDADGTIWTDASSAEKATCGGRTYAKKITKAAEL